MKAFALALVFCAISGAQNGLLAQVATGRDKVVLCGRGTTAYSQTSVKGCPEGLKARRVLSFPRGVYNIGAEFETWGVILNIIVTDSGLRFLPRSRDLALAVEQTDTVFLFPDAALSFEGQINSTVKIFSGRELNELTWHDAEEPDLRILTLPPPFVKEGVSYPTHLYAPRSGERIYFICAAPVLIDRQGRRGDPRCSVEDFTDPSGDHLRYALRRSSMGEWRKYSKWLWNYINAASIVRE